MTATQVASETHVVDEDAAERSESTTTPSGGPPGDRSLILSGTAEGLTPAIVAGVALMTMGLLLVFFFAYLVVFTPLTASRNQQRLTQTLIGHPLPVYRLVGGHHPAPGSAVAVLKIPALGVNQVVVQGTSAADLMNGPGLMDRTSLPGTPGNSVIAARRTTFGGPFGSIGTLRSGDRITVIDGAGTFTYVVSRTETVSAGQRDVVGPTATNRLTLVTAGGGLLPSGRTVALAKLSGTAQAVGASPLRVPTTELALSGDAWAGWWALLWSVVTVGLVLVALVAASRWRRLWLTYVFAAPIVLMTGLFACQALARALPATF